MAVCDYSITKEELEQIHAALRKGLDVRIHPDKYGVKIMTEQIRVLSRRESGKAAEK